MKAKKIIAIGLVAAMTLGMSTSVFASANPYATVDPKNAPQFSGWDNDYLPTDNVFHAKGQGWLESGVGINETVTNVIVPTMPNLNLKYGDPGPYDFGFDPQRLVDNTNAKKYEGKMNFTKEAKESGVYFLNGPRTITETGWNPALNTFDNKSIKLVGTNIGTEPVAFTVTARTKEGKNFTYLEDKPVAVTTTKDAFDELYNQVGEAWETYVTTPRDLQTLEEDEEEGVPLRGNPNKLVFAQDLITEHLEYQMSVAVGGFDAYSAALSPFISLQFVKSGATEPKYSREVLEDETANTSDVTTFLNNLAAYQLAGSGTTVDPSAVGMYLGLNTALGKETSLDGDYEAAAKATATLPAKEEENKGKFDAEATATVVVEGTPDNYDWGYISGEYGKFIKDDDDDDRVPFQTVAFWFDGVATKNNEVVMYDEVTHPEGVKIPKFEFTWAFSKDKDKFPQEPEPVVVAPKLAKVDGVNVTPEFAANPVFNVSKYGETGVTLTIDLGSYEEIKKVLVRKRVDGTDYTYSDPSVYYTVTQDASSVEFIISPQVFSDVAITSGGARYWKVVFDDDASVVIPLTFIE